MILRAQPGALRCTCQTALLRRGCGDRPTKAPNSIKPEPQPSFCTSTLLCPRRRWRPRQPSRLGWRRTRQRSERGPPPSRSALPTRCTLGPTAPHSAAGAAALFVEPLQCQPRPESNGPLRVPVALPPFQAPAVRLFVRHFEKTSNDAGRREGGGEGGEAPGRGGAHPPRGGRGGGGEAAGG